MEHSLNEKLPESFYHFRRVFLDRYSTYDVTQGFDHSLVNLPELIYHSRIGEAQRIVADYFQLHHGETEL